MTVQDIRPDRIASDELGSASLNANNLNCSVANLPSRITFRQPRRVRTKHYCVDERSCSGRTTGERHAGLTGSWRGLARRIGSHVRATNFTWTNPDSYRHVQREKQTNQYKN